MSDILIFGGTTEGRVLCERLISNGKQICVSVVSPYGSEMLQKNDNLKVEIGKKDFLQIVSFIKTEDPKIVFDATHPYALEISKNIAKACFNCNVELYRIERKIDEIGMGKHFKNLKDLINYLNSTKGIIFSTLGVNEVEILSQVSDYKERMFIRILPSISSLEKALSFGFCSKNIICMQGPFSFEMNKIMFENCSASILLTKVTGKEGGFEEKIKAAQECNMEVCIIDKAQDDFNHQTISLEEAIKIGEKE